MFIPDPTVKPLWGTRLNPDHALSQGMVASHLLNEGMGLYLGEGAGQKLSGVFGGGSGVVPTWQPSLRGHCLRFASASQNRVPLASPLLSLGNGTFTLAALLRFDLASAVSNMVAYGEETLGLAQLRLRVTGTGQFQFVLTNDVPNPVTATTTAFTDSLWHMVICTSLGASKAITLSVDGILRVTQTAPSGTLTPTGTPCLGSRGSPAAGSNGWNGDIAGMWGWNRALTAQEVAQFSQEPFALYQQNSIYRFYSFGAKLSPYWFAQGVWQ